MKTKLLLFFSQPILLLLLSLPISAFGQTFGSGSQNILSQTNIAPMDAHLADLDEDGDLDVVYSYPNGTFSWIENIDSLGNFGAPQVFANVGYFMRDIHSGDVDLDGDIDIIAVNSWGIEGLSWFENLDCLDTFSNANIISDGQFNVQSNCYPVDIDNDGDLDVVSHRDGNSQGDNIVWYRNNGLGSFGAPLTIYNFPSGGILNIFGDIHAADIDGDGDVDVLAGSPLNNQIDWYENLDGQGTFGPPQTIATSVFALGDGSLYGVDLDGDGDTDVLSGTLDDRVVWYENINGQGTFGQEQIIFTSAGNDLHEVYPEDVDGDGDFDVMLVQNYSLSWFENLNCAGSFSSEQVIEPFSTGSNTGGSVMSMGDIDGDGDKDLLIGDSNQIGIKWYENVTSSSLMYLPQELHICDENFEELCGPLSSTCNTYQYAWYYNDSQTSILVSNDQCYLPTQYGNYTLVAEDDNGSFSIYNTSMIEVIIPQPDLGNDIVIPCDGDPISNIDILNQGLGCDYDITWLFNNQEVQTGGETLMMSVAEGTVTVVISLGGCESVSDSITITQEYCCPEDLVLAMNCETGELYVQNLPNDISITTIFWDLNGQTVPNANDTSIQVTEEGTYSFGIIFRLPNGEECHHFIHFEYYEDYCCEEIGLNAVASVLNSTTTIMDTAYGPMEVPVVSCSLELDGSLSTCENSYHIVIQPYNPDDWSPAGSVIFDEWFSGQAPSSIPIPPGIFPSNSSGQFYIITFAVGPNWTPTYLPLWYQCQDKQGEQKSSKLGLNNETIALSPNPSSMNVSIQTSFESGTFQVYDLTGKILLTNSIHSSHTNLDISSFNEGVYLIQVQTKTGETFIKKFIKN